MKTRGIIIIICLFLFSSCIVKSLNPFFTKESIEFQKALLGKWEGKNKSTWDVIRIKDIYEQEKKDSTFNPSKEMLDFYKNYKDAYYISFLKEGDKDVEDGEIFVAVPFRVKEEILIDFIPYSLAGFGSSDLFENHLLKTHSLAKLEVLDTEKIKLTWLDNSKISDLYEQNKIRLKREIVGINSEDSDYVLSASSEELYKFLEKYISSDIEDKWASDTKYTLTLTGDYETTFNDLFSN